MGSWSSLNMTPRIRLKTATPCAGPLAELPGSMQLTFQLIYRQLRLQLDMNLKINMKHLNICTSLCFPSKTLSYSAKISKVKKTLITATTLITYPHKIRLFCSEKLQHRHLGVT
jgi:hypothetical protein